FLTLLELLPLPHSIPDFLFCDDWFCPLSIRQQYPCSEGVGVRFRRIHVVLGVIADVVINSSICQQNTRRVSEITRN
ncbi:hypothetical protein, partial [Trichormus variabilis]